MHPLQAVLPISRYTPVDGRIASDPIPVTDLKFEGVPDSCNTERSSTLSNKRLVKSGGEPAFAELAVVRMLSTAGWSAVWIDSFHRRVWKSVTEYQGLRIGSSLIGMPQNSIMLFWSIVDGSGGRLGGCWDVFAVRNEAVALIELKEKGPDRIRPKQLSWYGAALRQGIVAESFRLVEWVVDP